MSDPRRLSKRTSVGVVLAFGVAALATTAALSTPAHAASPARPTIAARGGVITPVGSKVYKISPYLPTLDARRWMVPLPSFMDLLREAGFYGERRAVARIVRDTAPPLIAE
jgi:hypothetical protein